MISPSGLVWRDSQCAQFHHHFVADARRPARVARRADVDVVRDARVVRDDEKKLFALLERADDVRAFAFQHAHDRAGHRLVRRPARAGRTSRRTRTRSPCMAVEVALSSTTISWTGRIIGLEEAACPGG